MDMGLIEYVWPPSEKSNGTLVALLIGQLTLVYMFFRPHKQTKQAKKSADMKLARIQEGTKLILSEVRKADAKHEEMITKHGGDGVLWQAELPEPSRVFSFLWDDVYDVPMTRFEIPSTDSDHIAMYALFDRVLRLQLLKTKAFTAQAQVMARCAKIEFDSMDHAFGKSAEHAHEQWMILNDTNVNEVESYLSGDLLDDVLEFADKAKKKLGSKYLHPETLNILAQCKTLKNTIYAQSHLARNIIFGIAMGCLPLWILSIFAHTLHVLGWTEFDRYIFTGCIGLEPLRPDGTYDLVLGRQLALNLVICCAMWWLSGLVGEALIFKATSRMSTLLKCRLMECVMFQDYVYFVKNSSTLQTRITADVEKVSQNLLVVPKDALMAVVMIVIKLYICLAVAPWSLVVVCLAPVPFVAYMNRRMMKYGDEEEEKGRRVSEQATSGIMDVIKNMKTVRFFANEFEELVRFRASVEHQARLTEQCQFIQKSAIHIFIFCITADIAFASYVAGKSVQAGDMKAQDITVFAINMLHQVHLWQNFFEQMPKLLKMKHPMSRIVGLMRSESKIEPNPNLEHCQPLKQVVRTMQELQCCLANLETAHSENLGEMFTTYVRVRHAFKLNGIDVPSSTRMVGVLTPDAEDGEPQPQPNVMSIKELANFPMILLYSRKQMPGKLKGMIEFDNVDFHYPTDLRRKVLNGMSFRILPGEKVGICGTAGCGKSTTMELICRLYNTDPSGGSILVDGVDIKNYNVHYLRRRICIVAQKTVLFKTTVRDNLWYGLPTYPGDKAIEEACKDAQIWDDIQKKPDKLLTILMDDGGGFSGGQEQRLAIARMLLRKPDIILLDEATASLDPVNERLVQDSLDLLMKTTSTTTLAIAHRLTTIKDSDKILVMDAGQIVEEGAHSELLRRDIKYEINAEGKRKVIAGFYHNQWDTQFNDTNTSTKHLREKIDELKYQIGVHKAKIDETMNANMALWHRAIDETPTALVLERACTTRNINFQGFPVLLSLDRASSAP